MMQSVTYESGRNTADTIEKELFIMNKLKRFSALLCASLFFMTGCSGKENSSSEETPDRSIPSESSKEETTEKPSEAKTYGATVSIEDIKKSYGVDDENTIMPLYNVSQTEEFTFNFNFSYLDANVDMFEFVTVHTDAECTDESAIYFYSDIDYDDDSTTVVISPMEPKLKTETQSHDYVYKDICTWGNAPIYYLAIRYDMTATEPVLLDEPIIIPFTVTNNVQAPNAKGVVDSDGRFKLEWDPVEGAEKYIVYKLVDSELRTGKNNHPMNGSKSGYKGMSLLYDDETTECEFDNFSGEGHGLVQVGDSISGQNYNVCGEYYVSAIVNGVESGLSAAIPTADLMLPYQPATEEGDNLNRSFINSIDEIPTEMEILNIDGTVSKHPIIYTEGVDEITGDRIFNYKVAGTALKGHLNIEDDSIDISDIDVADSNSGNVAPEDDVDRIPDVDVETIIPVDDNDTPDSDVPDEPDEPDEPATEPPTEEATEAPTEEVTEAPTEKATEAETKTEETTAAETPEEVTTTATVSEETKPAKTDIPDENNDPELIEKQQENTKDHISHGNSKTVENAPEGVYINAESAEEEWLALNLIQGNTEISVEAFPSLQNPYYLVDVFNKVYNQNPYILSITKYGYDYNTMTFFVEYVYDQATIAEKQTAIANKADEVVNSVITDGMSDSDKVLAIYDYLVHNSVYDNEALEAAETTNFIMDGAMLKYEDSFNAVGILVNGKGVCASYAYSFKVLSDLCGLDAVCVTGYLDGNLPHAWNMVKIDGQWYEIDCTNNEVNSGIPYYLFEADTKLAEESGYSKDKDFELDEVVDSYVATDSSKEYYSSNGLVADSAEAYKECIVKNVTADTATFAVRCSSSLTQEDAAKAIGLAFNELGLESKLSTLRYGVTNGFAVIILK